MLMRIGEKVGVRIYTFLPEALIDLRVAERIRGGSDKNTR